ncbi:MAG: redoxin domain-containing protein [Actinomycetota bacterium]
MDRWVERFLAGPKRVRWDELPPQIGDAAPNLELRDSTDALRLLSEFWSDGPALLLFWRHFGCGCGIDRASQLHEAYDSYREAGARVVVVGQGEPERAAAYAEEYAIECPVLVDPAGSAHDSYGLLEFTLPQVWYKVPYELFERYRTDPEHVATVFDERYRADNRPKVDNPWQQPGEFVVDADGVLQLTYRYQYCWDFPDDRVLTTAIREAA